MYYYNVYIKGRKCTNTVEYDIEYANTWYNIYSTYINSKNMSHKYVLPFIYSYYKNNIF